VQIYTNQIKFKCKRNHVSAYLKAILSEVFEMLCGDVRL